MSQLAPSSSSTPPVVDPVHFRSADYTEAVPLDAADTNPCVCGEWQFLSATCGGVYAVETVQCGASRAFGSFVAQPCKGKAGRVLVANVRVNADCKEAHPHSRFVGGY